MATVFPSSERETQNPELSPPFSPSMSWPRFVQDGLFNGEGDFDGLFDGLLEGDLNGLFDGDLEGDLDGLFDGDLEGDLDGYLLGLFDGDL